MRWWHWLRCCLVARAADDALRRRGVIVNPQEALGSESARRFVPTNELGVDWDRHCGQCAVCRSGLVSRAVHHLIDFGQSSTSPRSSCRCPHGPRRRHSSPVSRASCCSSVVDRRPDPLLQIRSRSQLCMHLLMVRRANVMALAADDAVDQVQSHLPPNTCPAE